MGDKIITASITGFAQHARHAERARIPQGEPCRIAGLAVLPDDTTTEEPASLTGHSK